MNKFFSLILLLLIAPVLFFIIIIIFIDDGLPVFFKQKRVGKHNKNFWIYKFRTMKKETPNLPTHQLTDTSSYYTKHGRILRKLSLDELPQLINILKSEMVFIGPRPALHTQYDLIDLRTEKNIHKLYPGVTGWAQVNGRDNLSINQKVKMDLYYKINKSFFLNCKIVYLTFLKVFKSEDVSI